MAVKHGVIDTDKHFIIDPVTRTIKNQSGKLVLIQYDHNSERFSFQCPRLVDGHDMSLCNKVEIHYINAGTGSSKSTGVYESNDLQVSTENGDNVTFSWLISQNATRYVGKLSFVIRFACIDADANVEYAWNTGIYSDISISKSIYNGEEFIENYVDVLEMWKQDLYSEGLKISSIEQTTASFSDGGINVITMTMTDGSIRTFEIQNGSTGLAGTSIVSIERTSGDGAPGTTDTYTITLSDDSTCTFQIYNGDDGAKGTPGTSISTIERTSGDGAPGTTDTYTITLTDGSTSTFQVYNGANGSDGDGSGDMTTTTYDPTGKRTDIFKYVDDRISARISDSIDIESSETSASSAAVKIAYDKAVEALNAASQAASPEEVTEAINKYFEDNPIEGTGDNSFYAVYGVTTNSEIETAYAAGKNLYCLMGNGSICPLYERYSESMHCFYKGAGYFYCTDNTWTEYDCPYENASNKVVIISSSSTDEQYPTAKAVYTLINQSVIGAIEGSY